MTVHKFGRTHATMVSGRGIPDWLSRQEEIDTLHDAIRLACAKARLFLESREDRCGGAHRTHRTHRTKRT
jgi:hypothetical protein